MLTLAQPLYLLLVPLALGILLWLHHHSLLSLSPKRKNILLATRMVLVILAALALSSPAIETTFAKNSIVFILDESLSLGDQGRNNAWQWIHKASQNIPSQTETAIIGVASTPRLIRKPSSSITPSDAPPPPEESARSESHLASAIHLALGLFPPGTSRTIILLSDGEETGGSLVNAARRASLAQAIIHSVPIHGTVQPDARITSLSPNRSRLNEGASLSLKAEMESTIDTTANLRLFENGIEVAQKTISLQAGKPLTETFQRLPDRRNLYTYRLRIEPASQDILPDNNEAISLVDVTGKPQILYLEGEPSEAHHLTEAMLKEGIRLIPRPIESIPQSLSELAGYDGVILSDVPARAIPESFMGLLRDYVETLGGGFLMIGGKNSFGVGGYYRTPIEEILPVKMKPPDSIEEPSRALALVIDRSGSMSGGKLEICKSATIATIELLNRRDQINVVAFDDSAITVVPIQQASSIESIKAMVASLNPGGGTTIYPGMIEARQALLSVKTKVKHMIVLTDGQSGGTGYDALAAQLRGEGITVSTVGVGEGADSNLLQIIANQGGGQFYQANDPNTIPRIFTQDAMVHMGKLIREEPFQPIQAERHPMVLGWDNSPPPPLLGYVKTIRKATTQVPLVTDLGDPLLAHWRFGLGKVTAFTSDAKSRWASLWVSTWPGFSPFWAQLLREMIRDTQSQRMELTFQPEGESVAARIHLMENAAEYQNAADIQADLFFIPATSLNASLEKIASITFEQDGPGSYHASFTTTQPGIYTLRARSGAQTVSTSHVKHSSRESSTGRINMPLLQQTARASGGAILELPDTIPLNPIAQKQELPLTPILLRFFLILFMIDLLTRRWDNAIGLWEWIQSLRLLATKR